MILQDVARLVKQFAIADSVYIGKLPQKERRSIGVYNSRRQRPNRIALGGRQNESYGQKAITFLVHWSKSLAETQMAAETLFNALEAVREADAGETRFKFVQLPYEIIDVGTDEDGIYEFVIEAEFIYEKPGFRSGEEGE